MKEDDNCKKVAIRFYLSTLIRMTRLDTTQESLKQAWLRMTATRHAILQLMSDESSFYTIEQIARQAWDRRMDTVTVYRIMQAFEELGLVHKLLSVNGFVTMIPNQSVSYAFFIDQETQKVVREVVETRATKWFKGRVQYSESLGSFDDTQTWEIVPKKEKKPTIETKKVEVIAAEVVKPLEAVNQEEKLESEKKEVEEKRKKKKKLHQKLREF